MAFWKTVFLIFGRKLLKISTVTHFLCFLMAIIMKRKKRFKMTSLNFAPNLPYIQVCVDYFAEKEGQIFYRMNVTKERKISV